MPRILKRKLPARSRQRSESEEQYEVGAIVGERQTDDGSIEYLVTWKGWPMTSNSWEPAENLQGAKNAVAAWEELPPDMRARSAKQVSVKVGGTSTRDKSSRSGSDISEPKKSVKPSVAVRSGTTHMSANTSCKGGSATMGNFRPSAKSRLESSSSTDREASSTPSVKKSVPSQSVSAVMNDEDLSLAINHDPEVDSKSEHASPDAAGSSQRAPIKLKSKSREVSGAKRSSIEKPREKEETSRIIIPRSQMNGSGRSKSSRDRNSSDQEKPAATQLLPRKGIATPRSKRNAGSLSSEIEQRQKSHESEESGELGKHKFQQIPLKSVVKPDKRILPSRETVKRTGMDATEEESVQERRSKSDKATKVVKRQRRSSSMEEATVAECPTSSRAAPSKGTFVAPIKSDDVDSADSQPAVVVNGEELWFVEDILGAHLKGKKTYYLVKWEGWGEEDNSWEPVASLSQSQDIRKAFIAKYGKPTAKRRKVFSPEGEAWDQSHPNAPRP